MPKMELLLASDTVGMGKLVLGMFMITVSYQTSNHQSMAGSSKGILEYPGQFAFSVWYPRLIIVKGINHI